MRSSSSSPRSKLQLPHYFNTGKMISDKTKAQNGEQEYLTKLQATFKRNCQVKNGFHLATLKGLGFSLNHILLT